MKKIEEKFKELQDFIVTLELNESDFLMILANLIFEKSNTYQHLDKTFFDLQSDISIIDDYQKIKEELEVYPESLTYALIEIAHKVLFHSKRIDRLEDKTYGH